MTNGQAFAEDVMHRANAARAIRRAPSVQDLGGEELLLSHSDELAISSSAGAVALAFAADWDQVADQKSTLYLLQESFARGPEAILEEVAAAIRLLPPERSARISPMLFELLEDEGEEFRSALAGGVLVDLALAESVGWAPVVTGVLEIDVSQQRWPCSEMTVRSAFRIGMAYPDSAGAVEAFLGTVTQINEIAADVYFALGSMAFARAGRATSEAEVDEPLRIAQVNFGSAVGADSEHDDARLMLGLSDVLVSLRGTRNQAELDRSVEEIMSAVAKIARFGSAHVDSSALVNSTRAAWAHVAQLTARATTMSTVQRDRFSPYEVLKAAIRAQKAAMAIRVGGQVWIAATEELLVDDQAFMDGARRILSTDPDDPLAGELIQLLDRAGESGKASAGSLMPATTNELKAELVARLTADGRTTTAALVADLTYDHLIGTPAFDDALGQVLDPVRADPALPQETAATLTHVAYFVLAYARRKTDATVSDGGFRDLASQMVDRPLEHHLQDDIGQALSVSPIGVGWTDERTNMSGGRADGHLVVGRDRFPFEFKAESDQADRKSLEQYVGQAARYTGGTAQCAFLVVLDTSTESERYNDLLAQSWTVQVPPKSPGGRTTYVNTVAIPANMRSPSELSKKKRRTHR